MSRRSRYDPDDDLPPRDRPVGRHVDHHYAGRPIRVSVPGHDRKQRQPGRDERAERRPPRPLPPALAPLAALATPVEVDTAYQGECPRGRGHTLHILHLGSRWRLFCTKGCSEGNILKAIGRPPDVLRYRPPPEPHRPKRVVYDYPAWEGRPPFQVVRNLQAATKQDRFTVRIDGKAVKRGREPPLCKGVVYRLAELLRTPIDEVVFWCEGEKDVEALRDLGLNAVTTSLGAHSYDPRQAQHFRGRWVAILPDNDMPGSMYAKMVANSLSGVAARVATIDLRTLPGGAHLPEGEDVSWWLANGGRRQDLLKAAEVPDFFKPAKAAPPPQADHSKAPLGTVEAAILAAIDGSDRYGVTTDRLPMLVVGLVGEEAWNARAREPIIRYRNVPKRDLAKARAGISRALGSLVRRGLIEKTGRWVRRARSGTR